MDAEGGDDKGSSLRCPDLAMTFVLWPGQGGLPLWVPPAAAERKHVVAFKDEGINQAWDNG